MRQNDIFVFGGMVIYETQVWTHFSSVSQPEAHTSMLKRLLPWYIYIIIKFLSVYLYIFGYICSYILKVTWLYMLYLKFSECYISFWGMLEVIHIEFITYGIKRVYFTSLSQSYEQFIYIIKK